MHDIRNSKRTATDKNRIVRFETEVVIDEKKQFPNYFPLDMDIN